MYILSIPSTYLTKRAQYKKQEKVKEEDRQLLWFWIFSLCPVYNGLRVCPFSYSLHFTTGKSLLECHCHYISFFSLLAKSIAVDCNVECMWLGYHHTIPHHTIINALLLSSVLCHSLGNFQWVWICCCCW